jgi:hypothetical protein
MTRNTFKPGHTVAFAQPVIRRAHDQRRLADARGIVVAVTGPVVSVDWRGTWEPHEDGGTVRHLPAANLTRVFPDGVVFGD